MRAAFAANPGQIAGIIVEPVPGNAGLYPPKPGYLEFLREHHRPPKARLLIFDEVMTGFRLAFGGAQERFGIRPDLTCFGKIIGGGLPVGAFGGRAEIMDLPGAARAGLSGGHIERQSARHGRRHRRAGGTCLDRAYANSENRQPPIGNRHESRGKKGGHSRAIQPCRLDVLRLFCRTTRVQIWRTP